MKNVSCELSVATKASILRCYQSEFCWKFGYVDYFNCAAVFDRLLYWLRISFSSLNRASCSCLSASFCSYSILCISSCFRSDYSSYFSWRARCAASAFSFAILSFSYLSLSHFYRFFSSIASSLSFSFRSDSSLMCFRYYSNNLFYSSANYCIFVLLF